jgi:hypothetical protein
MKRILLAMLLFPFSAMAAATDFQDNRVQSSGTILFSAATTGAIDLGGTTISGIVWPSAITNTNANFTMAPIAAGTYVPVMYASGSSIGVIYTSGSYTTLDQTLFRGARFIKVVFPANEGANRVITVISNP